MSGNMSNLLSEEAKKELKKRSEVWLEKGESQYIWVQTVDGGQVLVEPEIAKLSPELCSQMQSGFGTRNNPICAPPIVQAPSLALVFDYYRSHQAPGLTDEGRKLIDDQYLRLDFERIAPLLKASRYLQMEVLSDKFEAIALNTINNSPEEMQRLLDHANEHAEPQTLEDSENSIGASRRRLLKKLSLKKKKQLEEQEKVKKVEAPKHEDTCSVDDLLLYINGGDGDSKKGRTKKKKGKKKGKKDEFDDGDYDPAWKEKTDREVEDFARKLNVPLCQIRPDLNSGSRVERLAPHSPDENSLTDP